MRFIDVVAGVGGFRLGMERAGHECVWSCEIDKWCQAVYKYKFGETPAGDVRQVRTEDIPNHDILCAGFPCQSFSIAGRRRGFEDTRGTIFFEVCKIARDKRTPYLLLENVAGLLSAEERTAFAVVLESLGELGYDAEWQVLNSKDFGVPQNRERVYLVGHLGGYCGQEVFPIGEGDRVPAKEGEGEPECKSGVRSQDYSSTVDARYGALRNAGETYIAEDFYQGRPMRRYRESAPSLRSDRCGLKVVAEEKPMIQVGSLYPKNADAGRVYSPEGIARALKGDAGGVGGKTGLYAMPMILTQARSEEAKKIRKENMERGRDTTTWKSMEAVPRTDGVSGSLSVVQKDNLVAIPCLTPDRARKRQHGRRFKEDGEPMFTLTGQDVHKVAIYRHPMNYGKKSVYDSCEIHPSLRTVSRSPRIVGNIYPSGGEAGKIIDAGGIYPTVKQGKRGGKAGMPLVTYEPKMRSQRALQMFDGIAHTVRQDLCRNMKHPHNPVLLPNMRIRRLTPKETERLQGFPDDWTRWGIDEKGNKVEISDCQRYRQMGNAVTVPVVEFIARRLTT